MVAIKSHRPRVHFPNCKKTTKTKAPTPTQQTPPASAASEEEEGEDDTNSPPASLLTEIQDLPPIITNSASAQHPKGPQDEQHAQHKRASSFPPAFQKLVTLFAGRRKSSTAAAAAATAEKEKKKHIRRNTAPQPSTEPLPSTSTSTVQQQRPRPASQHSLALQPASTPPAPALHQAQPPAPRPMQPYIDIPAAPAHPLTGHAAVAPDAHPPTVVQRGFEVPGSPPLPRRRAQQTSVLDRAGDAWAGYYANRTAVAAGPFRW
ncbi:hypothetical protein BU26DRAFT_609980 [Trematosphaeria pertusa]|uniref:Uncharacterized protein n=1 Tax=Trematosphaeria pertusa TaxID=390896 RepID=A0A6A6HWU7_9PLEO|nr:uncharacterized protein BU26DRAFT_609980 [Trematosphaeria pertusa]KAF2242684.1 hypothetical protein BU26DRAFT_609980 [Trematosphaeria pertusa]